MVKKRVKKASSGKNMKVVNSNDDGDSKLFAFIATFFGIIGFIIAFIFRRDNRYVMYYARQSLVLFIVSLVVVFLAKILIFIPIIGWGIMVVLYAFVIVLWVILWIYALSGEEKDAPFIGGLAKKFNF